MGRSRIVALCATIFVIKERNRYDPWISLMRSTGSLFMALPRVSDIHLLAKPARNSNVLYVGALLSVVAMFGWGFWAEGYLDHQASSAGLAWLIVLISVILILGSALMVAMAIGTVVFGDSWREEHLVRFTPNNPLDPRVLEHRILDKTASFYTILGGVVVLLFISLQMSTSPWLTKFPSRGYVLSEFRSASELAQISGLRGVVRHRLDAVMGAEPLRERLLELMDSPSEEVRAQAVWATGRLGVTALDIRIRQALDDPSPKVRDEALYAMGTLATTAGIRLIIERIKADDPASETTIANQLSIAAGLTRNLDASRLLLERLPKLSVEQKQFALWAIAESGDVCAAPTILQLAKSAEDVETRCSAMNALKRIVPIELVPALRELYEGEDPWCDRKIWFGRSSMLTESDFHRILVNAERFREKIMDANFNAHASDSVHWYASIVNNPETNWMDRKHARYLFHILNNAPNALLEPQNLKKCPTELVHVGD